MGYQVRFDEAVMTGDNTGYRTTRRRFAFWVGMGLFSLGERLHAKGFDALAAAAMRATDSDAKSSDAVEADDDLGAKDRLPEHWTVGENNTWRWFERENLIDGQWRVTGITTPVHKVTGDYYQGRGYLEESLAPASLRNGRLEASSGDAAGELAFEHDHGKPSPTRRARHGRPPSRWLRSLKADELHIWLKTIEVPQAGVEGMTYWMHLTRDHSFDPARIEGLQIDDQAKLHAAAHYGY
jgi:hypothetical protein